MKLVGKVQMKGWRICEGLTIGNQSIEISGWGVSQPPCPFST